MNFKDYHGYKVYDNGVVIGTLGEPMAGGYNHKGYRQVGFWIDGKTHTKAVHRLMGELFLPNFKGLPTINHKDINRTNNSLYNLEWATYRDQKLNQKVNVRNKSGYVGVSFHKTRNKWLAKISPSIGKKVSKLFQTKEEAIKQRKEWELEFYRK